jgi:hypothetical protein
MVSNKRLQQRVLPTRAMCLTFLTLSCTCIKAQKAVEHRMRVTVNADDASYTLSAEGLNYPVLRAQISANIDGRWISSSSYPKHYVSRVAGDGAVSNVTEWDVTFSGLFNEPELRYRIRTDSDGGFGEVQATVRNTTGKPIQVSAIRMMDSLGDSVLNLGGPPEQNRVLSDSFSEDVPAIRVRDLNDSDDHVHRGVGSQLIYNRDSKWSFFAGAETSDHFITLLRLSLHKDSAAHGIESYAVESTGTTEITRDNSLAESPQEDKIPLSIEVAPNGELVSERLFFSVDSDYHRQFETYGNLIRELHHARIAAPVAMGWWSWTAYYYGLTEGTAITNAQWLAQNLRSLGFNYFHLDEGYQYARGEYTTPDATQFPHGMIALEDHVRELGLTPGLWTAPFEVSERALVFTEHKDWLVHNATGQPIHLGWANNHHDRLYALDTTNPAAQEYLRSTYSTLVNKWEIRYIKLDFMDDSAVEGIRYRPNTTAMEAQRIGLEIIRHAVGEDVLLDKDGSTMLNPVGYVDYGRIAQDTGHTFTATKEAAPAVAARYYMNRNFFVSDPDAFTVSTQTVKDHPWNGGKVPLTLEEAKVSIALSAVSGGMFEIGDDLPTLGSNAERLALVKNRELLDMVKLGKASIPVDLMSYVPSDVQPSIFMLREDARQSILTVFNWTDGRRSHTVPVASLDLDPRPTYSLREIFDSESTTKLVRHSLSVDQPGHSVRMFRLINTSILVQRPKVIVDKPAHVKTGEIVSFSARMTSPSLPSFEYRWSFGDGVSSTGSAVTHAYSQPGRYRVRLEAATLIGSRKLSTFYVTADGNISSVFVPATKARFTDHQFR